MVHLDHGSGMTGYVGKLSEVSWLQNVREYLVGQPRMVTSDITLTQMDLHAAQAYELTYFVDDENTLSVNEDNVDDQQFPPLATVLLLSEAYFHAVQGAFQFIRRGPFLHVLDQLSTGTRYPTWAQRRTMGLANIIWAVGAKWLGNTKLDRQAFSENHLTYYARALDLCLYHIMMFDHPDVQMTQAIGILAFYLFINGSIQR